MNVKAWTLVWLGFASLLCSTSMAEDTTWSIARHNGVMTVFRDDQPTILNILYNNDKWIPKFSGHAMAPIAEETGIHTYMMHATFPWPDEPATTREVSLLIEEQGTKVFEQLKQRIDNLFKRDPDAHVLWRIAFRAPKKWRERYPDHMYQDEKGNIPDSTFTPTSYGSDRFLKMAQQGVQRVVKFLESDPRSDRFIGYYSMTGYSGEWNRGVTSPSRIADYAPVNQQRFREFLEKKYGDITNLNKQLETDYNNFSQVEIPPEEAFLGSTGRFLGPNKPTLSRLYLKYDNDRVALWITTLCKRIKEIVPHKLSGVAYGYWFGQAKGGVRGLTRAMHLAWERVASSPDVDFFLSPPLYWLAGPDEPMRFHTLRKSVDVYDKIFLAESDQPTHLVLRLPEIQAVPLLWTYKLAKNNKNLEELYRSQKKGRKNLSVEERLGPDFDVNYRAKFIADENSDTPLVVQPSSRVPKNMNESIANIRRLGAAIVNQPIAGLWWWDMEGCIRTAIGGVSYNHPKIAGAMRNVDELFKEATRWDRRTRSEVLVVYSRDSILHAAGSRDGWDGFRGSLMDNVAPLGRYGAPYQDIYLEDLHRLSSEAVDQLRMIVFVNAHHVTKATREWIDRNLKNQDRTLLWFYGSGYSGDSGMGASMASDLTGIKLREKDRKEVLGVRVTNTKDELTRNWAEDGAVFGDTERMIKPQLTIADDEAEVLGVSYRRREPVFASKQMDSWTSVYLPGGPVPPMLLRALLREAGGHLYTDQPGVQVWATQDSVGLYLLNPDHEAITVTLPEDFSTGRVREWFTGKMYDEANIHLGSGEDRTFLFVPVGASSKR